MLAIVSIGHWFMWFFIAASFLLPYVAVVLANARTSPGPGRSGATSTTDPDRTRDRGWSRHLKRHAARI